MGKDIGLASKVDRPQINNTTTEQLNVKTVLIQTIQFSISIHLQCQKQSNFKQFSLAKVQTVLFQTVQFNISTQFQCQK